MGCRLEHFAGSLSAGGLGFPHLRCFGFLCDALVIERERMGEDFVVAQIGGDAAQSVAAKTSGPRIERSSLERPLRFGTSGRDLRIAVWPGLLGRTGRAGQQADGPLI